MAVLTHLPARLSADPRRVVVRPFSIAVEPRDLNPTQTSRALRIVNGVRAMDARTCRSELALVEVEFAHRHTDVEAIFSRRFAEIEGQLGLNEPLTREQRLLIGAYFSHEYSYAAAALMNPSIVLHPDQSHAPEGGCRIILSLRAVGEGHISSIELREGTIGADGTFGLDPLPEVSHSTRVRSVNGSVTLAREENTSLNGTVIFPVTAAQRNGLEDLRLVAFEEGEGVTYYGTYTAYSGREIASQLLVTGDFRDFRLLPMSGGAAKNKGMALFPRRIGGKYAVIGRQDNESLFYLTSDDVTRWDGGEKIAAPVYPWELVQTGNCGSPLEIDEGWLLLTHGVGPMRRYAIGALLLDKDDPRKVIGRTKTPILSPEDERREGYVPNVVYTCGALVHGRRLFLPHGIADSAVGFCWVELDELLAEMT